MTPPRLQFEWKITLGNILTVGLLCISATFAWANVTATLATHTKQLEEQAKIDAKQDEALREAKSELKSSLKESTNEIKEEIRDLRRDLFNPPQPRSTQRTS